MPDLFSFHARICQTAGGFLIHQDKVLLVHHKKLGIWLAPGGHLEAGELPHEAAEREVFEETNIHVEAISPVPLIESDVSQYIPVPFVTNLHWISQENYEARIASDQPTKPHQTSLWPRGCEQHFGMMFLVKPTSELIAKHDPNESLGIGWFSLTDLDNVQTTEAIKAEIRLAFSLTSST